MGKEYQRGNFIISTDRAKLDAGFIHDYLCYQSYWAQERPLGVVKKSIENSLCFGVYDGVQQVGFARIVTDGATFGWLCDVFIADGYKGRGLGKWLIETIVSHSDVQTLKIVLLATRDAHELYHQYGGFDALEVPSKWMIRRGSGFEE